MRVIKCGLRGIVRDDASLAFFERTVQELHRAKTAAHLLVKLWVLERFDRGQPLPRGEGAMVSLFRDAVLAVGADSEAARVQQLRALYQAAFPSDDLAIVLGPVRNWPQQAAVRYGAQVADHLSRCYPRCLERYLALTLGLDGRADRAELGAAVRAVMRKLPSPRVPPEEAALLVPARNLAKGYAKYDVKVKRTVMDYLPCMLRMAADLERAGQHGFAVLPLVGSLIPESVFIDTDTLLAMLCEGPLLGPQSKESYKRGWRTANPNGMGGQPSQASFNDDAWMAKQERLSHGQARLWERVLDLSRLPVRGPSWCFDNRIQTDGVSVAVYAQHERDIRAKGEPQYAEYPDEAYVHRLPDAAARALHGGRTIVSVDPGKQNIIFAVDASTVRRVGPRLEADSLRYTAKQRAAETHQARARGRAAAFRGIAPAVQGRSLDEWEAWLAAQPSRRTLDTAAFRQHIRAFYERYAAATAAFWGHRFHREERLDAYRRQQRSEARLVKAFKAKFGGPKDVVVAFGDGARNGLAGRAPGPSSAIRRLLQRSHYAVLDVHEPYTSKRCFACKRPDANNEACRLDKATGCPAWGVRRCCRCGTSWGRDFNACLNIDRIAREELAGLGRPDYLQIGG